MVPAQRAPVDERGRIHRPDWVDGQPQHITMPDMIVERAQTEARANANAVVAKVNDAHMAPALDEIDSNVAANFETQEQLTTAWSFVNEVGADLTGSEFAAIDGLLDAHPDLGNAFYFYAGLGLQGTQLLDALEQDDDVSDEAIDAAAAVFETLSDRARDAILRG